MLDIAKKFGASLDHDDFDRTKELLAEDCRYIIGEDILVGPKTICQSYEQNMLEGRRKFDNLKWGDSKIEQINNSEFFVHFTDYLTHKGIQYVHKCKQKLSLENGKIIGIEHMADAEEQDRLNDFYQKVGLK